MMPIPLTRNLTAWVDDLDYLRICRYTWYADVRDSKQGARSSHDYYAVRMHRNRAAGKRVKIWMHREIMGVSSVYIDHWDGDGLNNRRSNLRIATSKENSQNRVKLRGPVKSYFKGVTLAKGRWRARIVVNGKRLHLGYFSRELSAALAYDDAALQHYGKFARLNHGL